MLPLHHLENRPWFPQWNPLHLFGLGTAAKPAQPRPPLGEEAEAKEESRPKIGLVLSSGAAKGLAHVGVIQILEEHGVKIDAVAATSMGAYVASCWASGLSGEELESVAGEIQTPWDRLQLLDPVFPPRQGFMKGERIRRRLQRVIGNIQFDELERPLYVIATEMGTYEAHVFCEGSVLDAVQASLAIPGIFRPVTIQGNQYVDGGVSDPLPVRALLKAGMDKVIAVSVIPTVEELRGFREQDPWHARTPGWCGRVARLLNRHLNYFAKGNVLDVLRSSAMGAQIRVAEFNSIHADVYLRPIVCSGSWHDYHNYREYVAEGRAEAQRHLDSILALQPEQPGLPKVNPNLLTTYE